MAARLPRKIFASPFVITTLAACVAETTPPPQQPQPQPVTQAPPTTMVNPPPPTVTPPPAQTATSYEERWTVMKNGDKCSAMARVDCPKPKKAGDPVPTCNPPPPMKIDCPSGWDGANALTVVKYANTTECVTEPSPTACPQKAACNPPPPRKVACPTWQ